MIPFGVLYNVRRRIDLPKIKDRDKRDNLLLNYVISLSILK